MLMTWLSLEASRRGKVAWTCLEEGWGRGLLRDEGGGRGFRLFGSGEVRRAATTCAAVVLPRFGGPEVLEVRQVPVPEVRDNEVLVRVRAAGLNPLDCRIREGYGRSLFEPLLPLVLGREASGEVAALGTAASRHLAVGDAVFGALHPTAQRGTHAEFAVFSADQLARKPPSISHVEAAAIPFAALTAWRALRSIAGIQAGQRVLVLGASGVVGLSAVQLAAAVGCHVAATCGAHGLDHVRQAGADLVVDRSTEDLEGALGGVARYDAVLDTSGTSATEALGVRMACPGGSYVTLHGEAVSLTDRYGLTVGGAVAAAQLLGKQIEYGANHNISYWWGVMRTDAEAMEEIAKLAAQSRLRVPIAREIEFSNARHAHAELGEKRSGGKLVLTF